MDQKADQGERYLKNDKTKTEASRTPQERRMR